jgi:hypothetical protein
MVWPPKERNLPFVWPWRSSRHTPRRLPAGTPRSGKAGPAGNRLHKRREWPSPIERCCSSPARSKCSEMHQLWPGTAQQQVTIRHRTSCGLRIEPGASPARSTRRSSSPSVAPTPPPKSSLAPCRWGFDECGTESRRRSIATLPSATSDVGKCVRSQERLLGLRSDRSAIRSLSWGKREHGIW